MINNDLTISVSTTIIATHAEVWDALVNPSKIKKYLFGTETICDWKVGSQLIFQGEWEGTKYTDKGSILEIKPEDVLKYNYISSFSQLEDLPENRAIITMRLSEADGSTELTLTQQGFESKETQQHSQENWQAILTEIKKRVETNDWQ